MATGIQISPPSGITIGTTAIDSGVDTRVLFQQGGVVQQDANFTFNNTQKRLTLRAVGTASTDIPFVIRNSANTGNIFTSLGSAQIIIGTSTTTPEGQILVRNDFGSAQSIFTLQNGQYGNLIFQVRDERTASSGTIGSFRINGIINGGESGLTKRLDLGGHGLGTSYGDSASNAVWLNDQGNTGDLAGTSVISVASNFYLNLQTTKKIKFEGVTGNFGIGNVGTLGARLDVRAQGALSTDIAFRVRNSADTADVFSARGNGEMYITRPAFQQINTIYLAGSTDSILKYSDTNIGSIALGQGASISSASYYNTAIGIGATINVAVGFGIALGHNPLVSASGGIAIGDRARAIGTDSIVIGNTTGNTQYGGTNSIHIGKKGNEGNSIVPDNVFFTYFGDDNPSTVSRQNGSFGLLGQQAMILQNGTGTFGTDTFMGNGGNTLVVRNHPSVPSTNVADSFQQYSADIVAGNAAPHFRTEAGNIIKLYTEPAVTTTQGIANALTNLGLLSSSTISSSLNPATVGIQAGNATTTNTAGVNISKTITVTGGTLAASCVLDITTRLTRLTGNSSLADVRIYYNTSNSLTGATLIARSEPMQGTDQSVTLQRTLTISAGNIIYPFGLGPLNTDIGLNATAFSTSAFNVATTYFILICSNQSGTDQFACSMAKIAQYA